MLFNDFRYAARTLRKSPVFTAAAVLTLALGIGANTAIFSVVNAVLLRPLPFAEPSRLVRVAERNDKLNLPLFGASILNYQSWKEQAQSFECLGAIGYINFNLTGKGDPESLAGSTISPSVFKLLGIEPVLGRAFRDGEDRPGAEKVVIISEGLWKRRFGSDRAMVGKTLTLGGADFTVVGIAPTSLPVLTDGEIWTPLVIDPGHENRLNHTITVLGRLKQGVSISQAQAEMETVAQHVRQQYPEVKDWGIRLQSFDSWWVADQLRRALLVLLAAVVLVLLIACANVANLLLSRAAARQKELAVRAAIGASRWQLLRQLLSESLLLSFLGGVCGLLAAGGAIRLMNIGLPLNLLPVSEVPLDSTVLLFVLTMSIATGFLFGIAPAWQGIKTDLNSVLKEGSRSSVGGRRPLLRNSLVAAELALATVLLIGAGLLLQSLLHIQEAPLGFRADRLLTFQLTLPPTKYPDDTRKWTFYKRLLESIGTLPGVGGAAISSGIPMGAGNYTATPMNPVGKSNLAPGTGITTDWRIVSPGFFRTMGIPLMRGRVFTDQDGPDAPAVAVVSQETAKRLWGADDPIGKTLHRQGDKKIFTVVGEVGDVRNTALNQAPAPTMYLSAPSRVWPLMDVVVRTAGRPDAALAGVRQKVHELDRDMPVSTARTMDEWISNNAAQPRLSAVLLGVFAGVALLIAAIGVYGVLSYSVNQRTREIGLRMALGAQQRDVRSMVVREGMIVGSTGIIAGLVGAFAVSRVMASLLYGVEARDPFIFAGVAGVLGATALLACYVPALRASRVDPVVALKDE